MAEDISKVWATPEDMNDVIAWIKANAAKQSDLDVAVTLEELKAPIVKIKAYSWSDTMKYDDSKANYLRVLVRDTGTRTANYPMGCRAIVDNVHIRGNSERFEYEHNMTTVGKPVMYDIKTEVTNG